MLKHIDTDADTDTHADADADTDVHNTRTRALTHTTTPRTHTHTWSCAEPLPLCPYPPCTTGWFLSLERGHDAVQQTAPSPRR